jgi:hypothetical protein
MFIQRPDEDIPQWSAWQLDVVADEGLIGGFPTIDPSIVIQSDYIPIQLCGLSTRLLVQNVSSRADIDPSRNPKPLKLSSFRLTDSWFLHVSKKPWYPFSSESRFNMRFRFNEKAWANHVREWFRGFIVCYTYLERRATHNQGLKWFRAKDILNEFLIRITNRRFHNRTRFASCS